jgi:hypothetical protein
MPRYIWLLLVLTVILLTAFAGYEAGLHQGLVRTSHLPQARVPSAPWILTTVIWTATATLVAAALTVSWTHQTKISEFRQQWINDLRVDIADYLGASRSWLEHYRARRGINLDRSLGELIEAEAKSLRRAKVILWRIRLRINPRPNPFKEQDDRFLSALEMLIAEESTIVSMWDAAAVQANDQGRELLKREWQVTKQNLVSKYWTSLFRWLRSE